MLVPNLGPSLETSSSVLSCSQMLFLLLLATYTGYISGFFLSTGLAELALNKYKSAAKYFLQAQFDHFDYKEVRGRNLSQTVKVLRYVIHFLTFS